MDINTNVNQGVAKKFNLFQSVKDNRAHTEVSFDEIVAKVIGKEFKMTIDAISTANKKDLSTLKLSLPAFAVNGTFHGTRANDNIKEYSQLISLDYDKLEDAHALKAKVQELNCTHAAFISPSGKGVKVFIRIDTQKEYHAKAYENVKRYYDDYLSIPSDSQASDMARLCLLSHDPNIFYNKESVTFSAEESLNLTVDDFTENLDRVYKFTSKHLTFMDGSRNSFVFQFSCNANRYGIPIDQVIKYAAKFIQDDFPLSEIETIITGAYGRYASEWGKYTTSELIVQDDEWLSERFPPKVSNQAILNHLSANVAVNESTGYIFRLVDGIIDFKTKLAEGDFILRLKDAGLSNRSDSDFRRIINSESITKITPLSFFLQRLNGEVWDKEDRLKPLVSAMNLSGDFDRNLDLITRWLCTVYSFAMRGSDTKIHYNKFSRVVLILYSKARALGKTTFFHKLGMLDEVQSATGASGLDLYSEFQGEVSNDHLELANLRANKLFLQIDDINNVMIKDEGKLRSIISQTHTNRRRMYTELNVTSLNRASFAGTTNHRELLRDKEENRYMIFEVAERMNFESLNNIKYIQLWSQIRSMCFRGVEIPLFETKQLEAISSMGKDYLYESIDDDFLNELFEFDPEGRLSFREINDHVSSCLGFYINQSKLGSALKKLAPLGEDTKIKTNGNNRYRVREKDNPLLGPVVFDF